MHCCSPRHVIHRLVTDGRRVIDHMMYRISLRYPPQSVPVLSTPSTTFQALLPSLTWYVATYGRGTAVLIRRPCPMAVKEMMALHVRGAGKELVTDPEKGKDPLEYIEVGARHLTHDIVYRCSPRHLSSLFPLSIPPSSLSPLPPSPLSLPPASPSLPPPMYRCSPGLHHPPNSASVFTMLSTASRVRGCMT